MFCPACGSEERQVNQYCRECGTDLRAVRLGLEQPDGITASAISARDEIGRAVAAKIMEFKTASDLKEVAKDVLPEIEKFLESPHEKRLRRLRLGILIAAIGLGATLFFFLMSLREPETLFLIAIGLTAFLLGLGLVINGLVFTVPKQEATDRELEAHARTLLDQSSTHTPAFQGERQTAQPLPIPSVTENTTRHLTQESLEP
ncbi:MAG TPA: zinc ribbon domain-containing protein [Pyrinomonadaceae bacterium]|jgi:hypothetical protein